jgi:hypothetical protein
MEPSTILLARAFGGRFPIWEVSEDEVVALALSFIKTSYTRNINDLAPSSIGNVPVRF